MFIPVSDNVEKDHLPICGFLLMIVNIYVFIYSTRLLFEDPTFRELNQFFMTWGCVPKDLADGKVVGLVTSMFIHGNFSHILGNMLFMWTLMWSLEASLRWYRFLPLYLGVGLLSGFAQAAMNFQSDIPCIGASGAISGLLGAYLLKFGLWTKIRLMFFFVYRPITFHVPSWAFGSVWLLMQFHGHLTSDPNEPGVGWMCHLSGFFVGMVLCYLLDEEDAELKNDGGDLRILTAKQKAEMAAANEDEDYVYRGAEVVNQNCCLYCETQLSEDGKVGPNLYRCPNTSCGYLNIRKGNSLQTDETGSTVS